MPPKTSHRVKLDRAQHHLNDLKVRISEWDKGDGYATWLECDPDDPSYSFVKATADIPQEEFSPIIGDAIQNLRASLDHLVFALSERHSGKLSKERAKVPKFPIFGCDDPQPGERRFANASKTALRFVSPEALEVIEGLQPYQVAKISRGDADYTDSHLWKLNQLSNIEKHQTIHLVGTALTGIGFSPSTEKLLLDGEIGVYVAAAVQREAPATIARVPVRHTNPGGKMDVDVKPSLQIAFRDPPFPCFAVMEMLIGIYQYVAGGVLPRLERFL